jgi:hypothetical protein
MSYIISRKQHNAKQKQGKVPHDNGNRLFWVLKYRTSVVSFSIQIATYIL